MCHPACMLEELVKSLEIKKGKGSVSELAISERC